MSESPEEIIGQRDDALAEVERLRDAIRDFLSGKYEHNNQYGRLTAVLEPRTDQQ